MAINSVNISCDTVTPKSPCTSNYYKPSNLPHSHLVKLDFATEGNISVISKHEKSKKNLELKSPYLNGDSVLKQSRMSEKSIFLKKGTSILSSFPVAATLYKASSGEFRTFKNKKKVKKSVLTLPNNPAPVPQQCTVSDINDSEYFTQEEDLRKKIKKRTPAVHKGKPRGRGKDFEFYDRDAKYCSQMNVHLECSSTDMIKNYNGNEKWTSTLINGNKYHRGEQVNLQDVWAVLRNINRVQFTPSLPVSEEGSLITRKNNKSSKRYNSRKESCIFEACCTEEFSYNISRYDMDVASPRTFSCTSSFDKITVIDKQNDLSKNYKKVENNRLKKAINLVKRRHKNDTKAIPIKPKHLTITNQNNKCDISSRNYFVGTNENITGVHIVARAESKEPTINVIANQPYKNENFESNEVTDSYNAEKVTPCNDLFSSGNSGSSKAGLLKNIAAINEKVLDINKEISHQSTFTSSNSPNHQVAGITKVILSKGQNQNLETPKKKDFQTFFMPTKSVLIPKLTQADIKRRLTKQKFPIVILGKDELSNSSIKVINQEPPQFHGLDKQLWPFMLEWYGLECNNSKHVIKSQTEFTDPKKERKHEDVRKSILSMNANRPLGKQSKLQHNKPANDSKNTITDLRRMPVPPSQIINSFNKSEKAKPIRLRERMLKYLYKKPPVHGVVNKNSKISITESLQNEKIVCAKTSQTVVYTDTQIKSIAKNVQRPVSQPTPKGSEHAVEKRRWAKAKWASDFIDNVIRKMKNGVYYTHDNKSPVRHCSQISNSKEVQIQTISSCDLNSKKTIKSISKITIKKKLDPQIPGFDNTLQTLEIKTMNSNEIAIKHCVTNIIVHFDVNITIKPTVSEKNSISLIPLDITASNTKIFKCKTSILNAMLPAELCTIVPKMIRNLIESGDQNGFLPTPIDISMSNLSTIPELGRCEIPDAFKCSISPLITTYSSEIRRLLNGRYLKVDLILHPKIRILRKASLTVKHEKLFIEELMPRLSRRHLFNCELEPMMKSLVVKKEKIGTSFVTPSREINTCTALQPYSTSNHRLFSAFKPFNFASFLEIVSSFVSNTLLCSNEHVKTPNTIINNDIILNMTLRYGSEFQEIVTVKLDNIVIDIPYNNSSNVCNSINKIDFFTYKKNLVISKSSKNPLCLNSKEKIVFRTHMTTNNKKIRRKGYVQLYKKCKSICDISEVKDKATPLSKVTSLDDFLQVLGTVKLLSSVFDTNFEHKIMSLILEMKNWTTDINSKQALLVLLLANRKDTSNLMRYRPMILQGIAVNRITKANELDMEIEVIERENLYRLPQYEGMSYLPSSIENRDNLFEELCWIAKTTASDYQRPFDESSEKLLKSLLGKRKKLNPSYLRVMARYVGLGLLKPQK